MSLRAFLPATALACAVAVLPAAAPAAPASLSADEPRPRHSSDGVVGEIAPPRPDAAFGRQLAPRTTTRSTRIAPGVQLTKVRRTDARGRIAGAMLAVQWRHRRVRLDYLSPGRVASTAPVRSMMKRSKRAVGAINGDFFDIADTGAPLGLGKPMGRSPLHAPADRETAAFHLGGGRTPLVDELQLATRIKQHPDWAVTDVNSPSIAPDGLGVFTRDWGARVDASVTDGQTSGVRVAHIRNGRVFKVRKKFPERRPRGKVLVGRGASADLLRTLRNGERIKVRWGLPSSVRMAISGNRILARDGVITETDDREMHPRTAIGIDRDTRRVLMLVVDGRQRPRSRGLTMLETAELMVELGAEDVLNLDGGGSSTLVARGRSGRTKVRNRPSDGSERSVANAIQVRVVGKRR